MRPPFIVHWDQVQGPDDAHYPGSDELLSIGSPLGASTGLTQLGVHHELLLPGRRTSWPHAEADEDELVYVLEGNPHVWIDGTLHALRPGDAVGFPCGTGVTHTFLNDGDRPVRLLAIGLASRPEHRVHYARHAARNAELGARWWREAAGRELGPHDGAPAGPPSPRREVTPVPERRLEVPTLETERLLLRAHREEDAEGIFTMRRKPGALEHMLPAVPERVEDVAPMVRRVIAQNGWAHVAWVAIERASARFVGAMSILRFDAPELWRGGRGGSAEIGAELDRDYWGRGYVREVGDAVIAHAFGALGLHRLEIRTSPENTRALRVAEALGFEREGLLRDNVRRPDGRYVDTVVLARLAPPGHGPPRAP